MHSPRHPFNAGENSIPTIREPGTFDKEIMTDLYQSSVLLNKWATSFKQRPKEAPEKQNSIWQLLDLLEPECQSQQDAVERTTLSTERTSCTANLGGDTSDPFSLVSGRLSLLESEFISVFPEKIEEPYMAESTTKSALFSDSNETVADSYDQTRISSWYDAMVQSQRRLQVAAEAEAKQRRGSLVSVATVNTNDTSRRLKSAYEKKKKLNTEQQRIADDLNEQLHDLQDQVSNYHEVLDVCEELEKQMNDTRSRMENMRQNIQNENQKLRNFIHHLERQMNRSDDIRCRNEMLKKELVSLQMEMTALQPRENEKQCQEDKDDEMERGLIALKLELAQSLEMEDWQELRYRQMKSQLSETRTGADNDQCDESEDMAQRSFLRNITSASTRNLKKWGKELESMNLNRRFLGYTLNQKCAHGA